MHCVHIAYPRLNGAEFDLDHYLQVHVPLGLGLLWELCEVRPDRILLQSDTYGPDRTANTAAYDVVATLVFSEKAKADRFIDLFENDEAGAAIRADWARFTNAEPIAVLGMLTELDVDEMLARSARAFAVAGFGGAKESQS